MAGRAPVMTVTGLALAKACSQPGMVATGARVELVKNKMMIGNRPASPADSGSRTTRPSSRLSQENASPAATARATAARAAAGPAWNRNPMAAPTAIIRATTNRLRSASAATRPARTAPLVMGRDRNRSIIPVVRSSAMATPVWEAPNPIASTKMPGSR